MLSLVLETLLGLYWNKLPHEVYNKSKQGRWKAAIKCMCLLTLLRIEAETHSKDDQDNGILRADV